MIIAGGSTVKHAGGKKHLGSKKHKPTAQQIKARKLAAEKAAHTRHIHAVAKAAGHPVPAPAKWSPNWDVACCAAEALAASARLAGRVVTDEDVLALYWRTASGPGEGATLEATIEAAGAFGLGGARLAAARPATALGTGVVLGVDLQERHALTVDGHGVWTWGDWRPATCGLLQAADEAWELTWQ